MTDEYNLSDKQYERLKRVERVSENCGTYPGVKYEDATKQYGRLWNRGFLEVYHPYNPIHDDRLIITSDGRKALRLHEQKKELNK